METINAIELSDETVYPDERVLRNVLGESYDAYRRLLDLFQEDGMLSEWRYYRDGKAWLCKVQKKKKTIVWMSAWKGYLQATVYFPERFIEEVCSLDLREETKERIRTTERVGKSAPCIFAITGEDVLDDFAKVMRFKVLLK